MNSKCCCFLMGLFLIFPMYAQEILQIEGKVKTSDGEILLPGVSIMVKGTSNGTLTNLDGGFSITNSSNVIHR